MCDDCHIIWFFQTRTIGYLVQHTTLSSTHHHHHHHHTTTTLFLCDDCHIIWFFQTRTIGYLVQHTTLSLTHHYHHYPISVRWLPHNLILPNEDHRLSCTTHQRLKTKEHINYRPFIAPLTSTKAFDRLICFCIKYVNWYFLLKLIYFNINWSFFVNIQSFKIDIVYFLACLHAFLLALLSSCPF